MSSASEDSSERLRLPVGLLACLLPAGLLLSVLTVPQCIADEPVKTIRFATYNVSLYAKELGEVARRIESGSDQQAKSLASVIQTIRPDVLLLNEIDHDADNKTLDLFADKYLAVDQKDTSAIQYEYRYSIPSNTGVASMLDIDGNGGVGGANDAWGYGVYPGQYAMAVLSRFPIDKQAIRTFQQYRWSDLPDALRPTHPATKSPYYSDKVWAELRLSSKNHADVPVVINNTRIHLLASHPTPPVFDGPDDHNGCRNHDEIRFWSDYLKGDSAEYLVDDAGVKGGLADDALFVIAGDLNADPVSGDGRRDAIINLLKHPRLTDAQPKHVLPENASASDSSEPRSMTTADFGGDNGMRVDYVLPSRQMTVKEAGVFWPGPQDPRRSNISATDHRLVWVEVSLP
jgi:Endonuclease/Exonuclease/phosphatase family